MIVASIFGTTGGLEVQYLPLGPDLPFKPEDGEVAFGSQDVILKTDRDIFRINRSEVAGKSLTWIGLYREATEIASNRPGGYYGAGLWLYDVVLSGQLVAESLVDLADQVKNLAMSGGKFTKRIAEVQRLIVPSEQVKKLLTTKKPRVTGISPNSRVNALISNLETSAAATLEWAQVSHSAELFHELFIAHPEQFQLKQGQFENITERFDSVASAIQWAYNKRVIQLDGLLNKQKTQLDGAIQQLTQLNAEIGNKQAECESIRIDLSATRSQVQDISKEKAKLQAHYENELNKLKSLARPAQPQPTNRRPPHMQTQTSPQGAQVAAMARDHERGFFAQNWPLLSLIAVLMIAFGVLAYLFHDTDKSFKERTKKLDSAYIESTNKFLNEKTALEAKLKEIGTELEAIRKKIDPKKSDGKETTQVEDRLIPEANEPSCKEDAEKFIKFSYDISGSGKNEKRIDIYSLIAKECKLERFKTCKVTIANKIRIPFETAGKQYTGEILLPEACGKIANKGYGLTVLPYSAVEKVSPSSQ